MDRLGDDKGCRDVGGGVQRGIQSADGSCRDVAFIMKECGPEISRSWESALHETPSSTPSRQAGNELYTVCSVAPS